jgi:multiple antibiotic resistance protein
MLTRLDFNEILSATMILFAVIDIVGSIPIVIAIILNVIFVYVVLKSSSRIAKVMGKQGLSVIRKVFGVILLAISTKLFASNINGLF